MRRVATALAKLPLRHVQQVGCLLLGEPLLGPAVAHFFETQRPDPCNTLARRKVHLVLLEEADLSRTFHVLPGPDIPQLLTSAACRR